MNFDAEMFSPDAEVIYPVAPVSGPGGNINAGFHIHCLLYQRGRTSRVAKGGKSHRSFQDPWYLEAEQE